MRLSYRVFGKFYKYFACTARSDKPRRTSVGRPVDTSCWRESIISLWYVRFTKFLNHDNTAHFFFQNTGCLAKRCKDLKLIGLGREPNITKKHAKYRSCLSWKLKGRPSILKSYDRNEFSTMGMDIAHFLLNKFCFFHFFSDMKIERTRSKLFEN